MATHALVGYTLGSILADEPVWGLLGGAVADVDLLFPLVWQPPLVHRVITHTALVAATLAVLVARWKQSAGLAVGVGYASQLLVDARRRWACRSSIRSLPLGGRSRTATLLLWACCLAALYWWHR